MKTILNVVLLAFVSVVISSCSKFSNGVVRQKEVFLDRKFQIVEMCDNVNVDLKHCDKKNPAGTIIIRASENLLENISTEIVGTALDTTSYNKLIIKNNSSFDYLRPDNYTLEMTVYYDSLLMLIFNSNGTINTDFLRGYKTPVTSEGEVKYLSNLRIEVNGGSGDFTVLTNCELARAYYLFGTSNLILKGTAAASIIYGDYNCNGIIDARALVSNWTTINYLGTNTVWTNTVDYLKIINNSIGRVFYHEFTATDAQGNTSNCPKRPEFSGANIYPYN